MLRWWLHDPVLPGWNFKSSSRDRVHPTITWGNQFSSWQGGTGFHLIFVYQKPIDSHWFKNVHKVMKFYKEICLIFSRRWRHMHRNNRNNYDLLKCTSIDFFKLIRLVFSRFLYIRGYLGNVRVRVTVTVIRVIFIFLPVHWLKKSDCSNLQTDVLKPII